MSEIPKAYEPQAVEEKWYDFWLKQNCFVANPASAKPAYSIVIPPPNVTGMLHMGHVLNNTIQDILSRKARMDGKEVLWLPGTDHAGIATQAVVEKTLRKQGVMKHRDDLGREKFLEHVWAWKEKHGGIIIQQLKKLGCSCDWARERFTMDPDYSRCVQKVFVELYKKGLIYRGKRMVNWDPAALTALSDEEVVMKEHRDDWLYYFNVEVVEEDGQPVLDMKRRPISLTIATTRPETIPGDVAVAVNPKDERFKPLKGLYVVRPLPPELPRQEKLIPIIEDEHVDVEFGTGALKVTPAHDKADFEIGLRHSLPAIDIMNPDATMNALAGKDLAGLDRDKAREVAFEKLKEVGALAALSEHEHRVLYTHNVGYSERSDVQIEQRLSEQWFLKYPSVEKARECVEQPETEGASGGKPLVAHLQEEKLGSQPAPDARESIAEFGRGSKQALARMKFHPNRWAKVYEHWMTNLRDWCISRQLWWGHRVPVWTRRMNTPGFNRDIALLEKQFEVLKQRGVLLHARFYVPEFQEVTAEVLATVPEPSDLARLDVAVDPSERETVELLEKSGFTQDPDVLDTWFSSWLWPFATMGWPEQTPVLKKFYPTSDLVTGPDIIFFWVARMIMAGYEFMGDLPFRNVYFTGIIRDKLGRKMSKSLGNSPDPLELIAKYGADALRFGTMRSAPLGQDVLFDEKDVELGRNFCNKLWNACRFRQMQGGDVQAEIEPRLLTSDDKWILLKLDQAIREITAAFEGYRFNEATQTLYRFFWSEYCDWYVEASKAVLSSGGSRGGEASPATMQPATPDAEREKRRVNTLAVIDFVLSHTLRLFHPFLPFITEELWHGMGYYEDMPESQGGSTIMYAPWPKPLDEDFRGHYGLDACYLDMVNAKYELVTQGRNLRREGNIPASKKVKYVFKPANQLLPHDAEVLKLLLNAEALEIDANYVPKKGTPAVHSDLGDLFLPMEGLIDVAAEKARHAKELEKIDGEITKAEQKLSNPNFTSKAPPHVLQEHQQRLAEWQAKRERIKRALDGLQG